MKLRTYTNIPPSNVIYIYFLYRYIYTVYTQIPNHHHLVPNRTFSQNPPLQKRMGFTATKKKLRASSRWCHQIGFSATPTTDPWLGAPIVLTNILFWGAALGMENCPCWMIKCEDIRNVTLKQIGFGLEGGYEMINLCLLRSCKTSGWSFHHERCSENSLLMLNSYVIIWCTFPTTNSSPL